MPLPKDLQQKKDAAQSRLNDAKSSYSGNVTRYNEWVASIQDCYKDPIQGAEAAASWYNLTDGPCMAKGKCVLHACKTTVDKLNADIIPALRAAYSELNAAQANFDKVVAEIAEEIKSDPEYINAANQINADAQVAKNKWTFFGISVVIVLGAVVYLWMKTEIKKGYLIGGAVALILLLYVVFFGLKKK